MALSPFRSFGSRAVAYATAGVVSAFALAFPAMGQTAQPTPVNAPAASTVPYGQCAAFGSYVLDESDTFGDKLSSTFLDTVSRFVAAKCATRDAKGEIQIITMNDQDAASLRTARKRMGSFDILSASGVRGCARPPSGICPATTSSNPPPRIGG